MPTKDELKAAQEACKAEIKKLQADLTVKNKEYFEVAAKDVFEQYPKLESFGWTQYTPHFNDGDPCRFRVNAYPGEMYINGEFQDDLSEDGCFEDWGMSADEVEAIGKATYEVVKTMDKDSLEKMFGEGKVTVTCKNGKLKAEADDYDHD